MDFKRALASPKLRESAVHRAVKIAEQDRIGPHPLAGLVEQAAAQNYRELLLQLVDDVLVLTPSDPRAHEIKALLQLQLGHLAEAEQSARKSLQLRPHHPSALNLLATVLTQACRFDDAIAIMLELYRHGPKDAALISNMGYMEMARGDLDSSLAHFREAIMLRPTDARIRLNYSIALLKAGFFHQGWTEHEWRLWLPGHTNLPRSDLLPTLSPEIDLKGKHVLLLQEEGLGDTLMYLRYAPLLAERGAILRVFGSHALAALSARVKGVSSVQVGGATPTYDYHCPFISLPRVFALSRTPLGAPVPYLKADPVKVEAWRKRFTSSNALQVGLVWAGAPHRTNTDAFMVDHRRSISLETFRPLFSLKGARFYSLQKGDPAKQLKGVNLPIVNYMDDVETMDDTAALIENLDIIVSVDTSIVHLAGGLGKPTLLMNRINGCWRWGQDQKTSIWYPQLEIIQQTHPYNWDDVIASIKEILKQKIAENAKEKGR